MKKKEYNFLVINESTPTRKFIKFGLREHLPDIHVDEVATGAEAIEKLNNTKYDCILCDWDLPDISGYKIIKFTRTHPSIDRTPIIIISSRNDKETVLKAIQGGANSYIVKPFGITSLVEKIKAVFDSLERRHLERVKVSGAISLHYDTNFLMGNIIDLSIEGVFATLKRNNPLPTVYDEVLVDMKLESDERTGIEGFIVRMQATKPALNAENIKIAVKFSEPISLPQK